MARRRSHNSPQSREYIQRTMLSTMSRRQRREQGLRDSWLAIRTPPLDRRSEDDPRPNRGLDAMHPRRARPAAPRHTQRSRGPERLKQETVRRNPYNRISRGMDRRALSRFRPR